MKINAQYSAVILLLLFTIQVNSQESLTLQAAIDIALQNNFDIAIAKTQAEIAARNNTVGNAGMLPRVQATLSDNYSINNLNQVFTNGTEIDRNNVTGNNLNAGVSLGWTLFDGMKMFATKSKLKRLEEIGTIQLKQEIENTIASVMNAYYGLAQATQQADFIKENIRITEERVKLSDSKFKVGLSSKVDLLQAQVDLNEQKSNLLNQLKITDQLKASLNLLLARDAAFDFNIADSIPSVTTVPQADITTSPDMQRAGKLADIARLEKKEAFAQFLPVLTGTAGYSYNRANSTAGFSLFNQTYGFNGGFSLNIPLFNGLNNLRQYKVAAIQLQNAQFNLQRTKFEQQTAYYRAMKEWNYATEWLKMEEENIALANENATIALERFRLSQSTSIELREAQLSYVAAKTRLLNARLVAKNAETELLRLQGKLVSN